MEEAPENGKEFYSFIYLFKLISIHPNQVHTMGMERDTFIIHLYSAHANGLNKLRFMG
jgi:hypothetical protein